MGKIHIGISGWRHAPWRGVFYPPGLAQAQEFAFAARVLSSIEINGSFYALQRPHSYAAWSAGAEPDDARRIVPGVAAPVAAGRDVYCYFDNDVKVRAPFDARRLIDRLGLGAGLERLD